MNEIDLFGFLFGISLAASLIAFFMVIQTYCLLYDWIWRIIPIVVEYEEREEREKQKEVNDA